MSMNQDMAVIVQKWSNGHVTPVKMTFQDYTNRIHWDLKRLLNEIERCFENMNDGKQQKDWPQDVRADFAKVRGTLLTAANNVQRLPNTLHYKNTPCNAESMGDLINKLSRTPDEG